MRSRQIVVTVLLALVTLPAPAQDETFFSEVMEVRVTNVDVVVTGRDGKPVTGLTRDDFEIYENGVKKELSNFLEIRESGVPALTGGPTADPAAPISSAQDIQRRDITIFIDNAAIHPFRRNQILPLVRQFVERNVRPGDSLSIVSWANSLKLELEPTTDRAAISNAVERLQSLTTLAATDQQLKELFYRQISLLVRAYADQRGPRDTVPPKPPWSSAISEARAYAMQIVHSAHQRIEAVKSVISWRRGVEGRKILVLLTAELPMNPAEEPFLYLEANKERFEGPFTMATVEMREFEMPSIVAQIAETANSSGVTLYPIDTMGKESGMPDIDASRVVVFTESGVARAMQIPSLRAIAEETGGVALSGSDNWQLAFDTISNDLGTYYSLGYRSTGERQDRMKRVEVKLKNKRHNVRTRRAVIEKSLASEMHDAVAANLFRPSSANDLSIKASIGTATPNDDGTAVIPLTVTIPMDKLTLLPDGADLTGRFAVYAAFLRKDGAVSKVAQQPGAVRFPADSLKNRKELKVRIDVNADKETGGLSIGVMDEVSRATGFASIKLSE
jgi:VWFA-related protein